MPSYASVWALFGLTALAACNEAAHSGGDGGSVIDAAVSVIEHRDAAGPGAVPTPALSEPDAAGAPTSGDAATPSSPLDAAAPPRRDAGEARDAEAMGLARDAGNDAGIAHPPDLGSARDAGRTDAGNRDAATFDAATPGRDAGPPWLPPAQLDLAVAADDPDFFRWFGSASGDGSLGLPVTSGDLDGDGHEDLVMASFQASPLERSGAGQVVVVFGDGDFSGALDLAVSARSVLTILGDGPSEATGDQLGVGDVDGDDILDLLLCRQNYRASTPDRIGAGALSIVRGGVALRALADQEGVLDLRSPVADVPVITLLGAEQLDRLGIWVRSGDLTGDGIEDIAVGADQADRATENESGVVYVLRGGAHLEQTTTIDLGQFGSTSVEGHLAKVLPPPNAARYHFGATLHIGDLDRNGRAELVAAAALVRSGASYVADGASVGSAVVSDGAPPGGRAYVIWDDNFPATSWEPGLVVDLSAPPGSVTELLSGATLDLSNERLGEELLAGGDYDADGREDLFVGDMIAYAYGRSNTGAGFLIYDAARLRGLPQLNVLEPPSELEISTIVGPISGAIATDTVRNGDFDGDGITDLAVASPNASPDGRIQAGTVHVLWGTNRRWPSVIDLGSLPSADLVQVTEVWGAAGGEGSDSGDMLSYSAEVSDVDGDGLDDLIANEMGGNGVEAGSTDAGNLLVISGALLSRQRPDCRGVLGGGARIDACGECSDSGEATSCVSFEADVLPIFLSACPSCHGGSGGLSLFTYDQLMAGNSANGPVVIPGAPEQSILWQKLVGGSSFGDSMPPPPEPPLPTTSIDAIAEWIRNGARDN